MNINNLKLSHHFAIGAAVIFALSLSISSCNNKKHPQLSTSVDSRIDSTTLQSNDINQEQFTISTAHGEQSDNLNSNIGEIINDDKVYEAVEVYPIFKDGMENLPKFLGANLVYPESARIAYKQGTSFISFIIEKDGSVTNVQVKEGFDRACDEEAMRVVKLFPKWTPGYIGGKPVRTRLTLPVQYSLTQQ